MVNRIKPVACVLFVYAALHTAVAQQSAPILKSGYYAVVGSFRVHENAINFNNKLIREGFPAQYGKDPDNGLHYVYFSHQLTREHAVENVITMRENKRFADAWVKKIHVVEPDQQNVEQEIIISTPESDTTESEVDVLPADDITQFTEFEISGTEVFLSLYQASTDRIIDGEVSVIDTERATLIRKFPGNDYLKLDQHEFRSGKATLLGEVFGYRKVQHEINYPLQLADTVSDFVELVGTILVINFDMIRYRKGDINVLYNVYFYNDAAVMLPESRYELNNLLEMMRENQNYRIRLHGHTNGNYSGKIISLGPDKNFFSLDGSGNSIGTAKDLSGARAETIRQYLITNGISGDRIETKAWGGKRPLFDKNGVNAKKNVRVEVEILQD